MQTPLTARQLGIGTLEAIPWGNHVCHLYRDEADLLGLVVPYLRAGLAHNECCIWITSGSLGVKHVLETLIETEPECRPYIESGQLEIHPYTGWYSRNGRFDRGHALQRLNDRLRAALDEGYEGLRISGNALWLEGQSDWETFSHYEQTLDQTLVGSRMLALFTYPLQRCSATDVSEIVRHHGRVTIQSAETYELVLTTRSPRYREEPLDQLGLTPRETEVLQWVIEGKVTSEVGNILAISPRTVQKHLERIYQKLGVEGRTAAAVRGVELLRPAAYSRVD